MKKVKYSDIDQTSWDNFILDNDFGWYYHTLSYLKSLSYLGTNESFAIVENGEIFLLFVMYRQTREKKHFFGLIHKTKSILQSNGGFVIKDGLTEKQKNKVYDFFKQIIDDIIIEYNVTKFWTTTTSLARAVLPESKTNGVNPLIFLGFKPLCTFVKNIALRNTDIETLFKQCNETTKQEIRKIQSDQSYRIRDAQPTQEDLDVYYKLHLETYKRTGAAPFPKSYFEELFYNELQKKHVKILFLLKDNIVISSNIAIIYKNCAKYLANASTDTATIRGNRYLLYNQILAAKQAGCDYFEIGGVYPYEHDSKLKGLTQFKSSFGGFYYPVFEGSYLIE